jgi:hypothetical protein
MSTLETNNISKYNGNNVSMGDALKLKSYTTTQRNALLQLLVTVYIIQQLIHHNIMMVQLGKI